MKVVNLREFHRVILSVFNLNPITNDLLTRVMAGSEKATDYEEILKADKFFTKMVCQLASVNMKQSVVSSIGHGVVVVGQQRARDFVLGHSVARIFSPNADSEFISMEATAKKLEFTLKAEEHARKCQNEYPGIALAAGYIYDIFAAWLIKESKLAVPLTPLLNSIWRHGLNTATMAWALTTHPRIFISRRKIIFAAGLLHDIGQMALAIFAPQEYLPCLEKMKKGREVHLSDDAFEVITEREFFDISHVEAGSALVFQTKFLKEMEMEIDFQHDSTLLKTRNPEAFLGSAVLTIADQISCLIDRKPNFELEDLQGIIKPHASYFPLKSHDVMELYGQARSKGLIST